MIHDPESFRPLSRSDVAELVYDAVPWPILVASRDGRLVGLNAQAETLAGLGPGEGIGLPVTEVFGLHPEPGGTEAVWTRLKEAWRHGERVPCRIRNAQRATELARLQAWYVPFRHRWYWVIVPIPMRGDTDPWPAWALQDALTGLGNRRLFALRRPALATHAGAVVFCDVDNLKRINDTLGHVRGDEALVVTGRALSASLPADGLAVRWGGDEFLVVLPGLSTVEAASWAESVRRTIADETQDWPMPVGLSAGVAYYAPGQLESALAEADARLYEQKGLVLRSRHGGRLVIVAAGAPTVLSDEETMASPVSEPFSSSFAALFREQFVQSRDEARAFVGFIEPEVGSAAVEVGAGGGRIAVDGGLAERIGPEGVLLLTDPSRALLRQALHRARQEGMTWVRGLQAYAERLPLLGDSADLVVGALFWHLAEPRATARELYRILRPGGRAVLSTSVAFPWPPAWVEALAPIRAALARHALSERHFAPEPGELAAYLAWARFTIEREGGAEMTMAFHDLWALRTLLAQGGYLEILVRPLPEDERQMVIEQVLRRVDALWPHTRPGDWSGNSPIEYVAARRPD